VVLIGIIAFAFLESPFSLKLAGLALGLIVTCFVGLWSVGLVIKEVQFISCRNLTGQRFKTLMLYCQICFGISLAAYTYAMFNVDSMLVFRNEMDHIS
jgi:hypothetical protein